MARMSLRKLEKEQQIRGNQDAAKDADENGKLPPSLLGNAASLRRAAHVLRLDAGDLKHIRQVFTAVVMGEDSQLPRSLGDVMRGRMRVKPFAAWFRAFRAHE
jgi:hypothetical protein